MLTTDTREERPYLTLCDSHDRAKWLAMRRSGIGASEAAIVIGEHSRHSLSHLVAEKRGLLGDDEETKEFLEWGLRLEPVMIDAYSSARYAGRQSQRAGELLRSIAYPWALATLDAWTTHPVHGLIPLELKTTDWGRDAWEHGPPPDFWWQCQWQMLVTDAPCASIACLLGPHRLVWADVERDEAAIRRLIIHGREAWELITSGREPPGPYDDQTFRALWPHDDGSTVELDESFGQLDAEREELRAVAKTAETRIDQIDALIKEALRNASFGVLPGGRVKFSLKTVERKEYVAKATSYRTLRRHETKEG